MNKFSWFRLLVDGSDFSFQLFTFRYTQKNIQNVSEAWKWNKLFFDDACAAADIAAAAVDGLYEKTIDFR